MSKMKLSVILAAAGIVFQGADTADAKALASALQTNERGALMHFLKSYPDSPYVADVVLSIVTVSCGKGGAAVSARSDCTQPGYRG
jgi:hypothetical protein